MSTARNGGCEIYYETFGDRVDPALLLVNGLGSQCINYHEDWCAKFVAAGLHVIRFDHPDRLLSMTSVMSTTGEPEYGTSSPEAWALLTAPAATDREGYVQRSIDGLRVWGSPAFADEDRWRRDAERAFDRSFRPTGVGRQFLAAGTSAPRGEKLRSVTVPALVIHGDKDTLIDQSGGRRTAELIPGARFELIEGMGHDYPPQVWDRWVQLVGDFVHVHDAAPSR